MAARRVSVPLTLAGLASAVAPVFAVASIGEFPSDLREAVVGAEYGVVREGQDLRAPNPAQAMSSAFSAERVRVSGADETRGSWALSLALEAWGREGTMQTPEPAEPTAKGRRVEYRRGPLTEWYVNEARGLEQGFTINEQPVGEGPLWLLLSIGGGLSAEVLPTGRDALFTDAEGSVLHYTGLRAWDATGRDLEASLVVAGDQLSIRVEVSGAVYPVNIDPCIATVEAQLTSSDADPNDQFGISVSLSGDTALVGADLDDHAGGVDAGSAYVFVRSGTSWILEASLTASDPAAGDAFGHSVSLSGDTALVAAWGDDPAGSAYVFVRSGTSWTEQAMLTASNAAAGDFFGVAVSVSGDTAVVGATGDDHAGTQAGSAYVFVRSGTRWTEQAKLTASDAAANDYFGASVSLSGDTALVGAPQKDHASGSGSAYVFVRSGASWTEQAMLSNGYLFGSAVSLTGDTALVGAPASYAAYVFVRSGTSWTPQAKLTAGDEVLNVFGSSVSLSADRAVVGKYHGETIGFTNQAGSAYLFVRSGTSWTAEARLTASVPKSEDHFGYSVSLSGDRVLVGAPQPNHSPRLLAGDSEAEDPGSGSAYVFRLCPPATTYCTAGTSASGCQAALSASGFASASAPSGFDLMAANVEGAKDGMFYLGTHGKQASPWGNGTSFQCVVPPLKRAGLHAGAGTVGACDGAFSQDLNAAWCPTCPKSGLNPGAGATVQAQLWYRDPLSTSNQTTSLSDAIEFVLTP